MVLEDAVWVSAGLREGKVRREQRQDTKHSPDLLFSMLERFPRKWIMGCRTCVALRRVVGRMVLMFVDKYCRVVGMILSIY